ncbi:DEAD/DEAH box helicase family protein [Bacillus sp. AFS017274]|uniref:DEAD/DEAH box helicase family protein n=1 Tax=Bacillus sp. AFS017274 TaxID=2033488 RepID=UPI000BF65F8B|nr:DEAD/DEAH box helicase family protein [Bacillus sp. AFS017274]PEZ76360.1 hypothetical protein CN380_21445 [Bacillus sp. AFS017274]
MLRDLTLKAVYDTSGNNISEELIIPLLSNAMVYNRGVGYFTSNWISLNLQGILTFIKNGGKARIVTSPFLEDQDIDAIYRGEIAKQNYTLYRVLSNEVKRMREQMDYEQKTLLAWLIADGLLTFKIAIPQNNKGAFHDKYAIFCDENGDKVVLHGSLNDSLKGFTLNGEGVSVFKSWEPGLSDYITFHEKKFEQLIENDNDFYKIYDIPESVKQDLINLKEEKVLRPYINTSIIEQSPRIPETYTLYGYQQQAIDAWLQNDYKGFLSMATGTGKTVTALATSVEIYKKRKRIINVISVPFMHLVEQWNEEAKDFGFVTLCCLSTNRGWKLKMRSLIDDYNYGDLSHLTFIVTHTSNADEEGFLAQLARVKRQEDILFIADEVHYLGSQTLSKSLVASIEMRLGLSATPERWMDKLGTKRLTDYFVKEIFTFPIEEAIAQGFLTPYTYVPNVVFLTEDEQKEYTAISKQIAGLMNDPSADIEWLRFKRNNIVHKSYQKRASFYRDIEKQIQLEGSDFAHSIVYCPEGLHRDVLAGIAQFQIAVQEIIGETKVAERHKILKAFDNKRIQLLVAMKCLDEGVNIPATKRAYFLANTSNPRQFIQRRGRVLRRATGKERAVIHDYLVFPYTVRDLESDKILVKKELARFMEFQFCADNARTCIEYIRPFLEEYDLTHLIYLSREEIYEILGGQYE